MQIGANFANDYYDYCKGADGPDRMGPARAVATGAISPAWMRMAAFCSLGLGFVLGLVLFQVSGGGWLLLVVGVASVACALAYTSGPWPLAYLGLGDVFVILFFGFIAVSVTHFVQLSVAEVMWKQDTAPWIPALAVGLVINNLLVVNNHRDADTDRRVGKLTIVARFGRSFGSAIYFLSIALATLLLPLLEVGLRGTLVLFPLGYFLWRRLMQAKDSSAYSFVFAGTATMVVLYGALSVLSLAEALPKALY